MDGSRVFEEAEKGHVAARNSLQQFFHTWLSGYSIFNICLIPRKSLWVEHHKTASFLQLLQNELDLVMRAKPLAK